MYRQLRLRLQVLRLRLQVLHLRLRHLQHLHHLK
jgi:hypothetical protein